MTKAHAYIAKYNIEIRSEETRQTYCTMCVGESAVRQTADKYRLAAFLRHYYFVEGVWIPTFVVHDGRQGRVLELSGNVENVKMAEYVHGFLSRTITEQWDLYQAERWASKMQRTDFAIGLIDGFSQKLDAQTRTMECEEGQAFALIKGEDVRLKAYLNERYPRLRQVGRHGRCIDEAVHGAGVEAGRATILNRPIESGAGGTVRMLTA